MIAVDTNLLVYSHRADSPHHQRTLNLIQELRESREPWAIPWPCVHEFLAIVTHPRVFKDPTPASLALEAVEAWLAGGNLQLLSESAGYLERLHAQILQGQARGPLIHDARVAALCLHHGVRELWSADRDFSRFPELTVRNPLTTDG